MPKAFVDTTILVDALLNVGVRKAEALAALARYENTDAPTYAIKELRLGALKNFTWFHNKLALNSFADSLAALQKMALTPRRYTTATALQAIQMASARMAKETPKSLADTYGENAKINEILKDRWRLSIKRVIYTAWRDRRKLTDTISVPCDCFKELPLIEGPHGTIESDGIDCNVTQECAMAAALKARPDDLKKLREVVLRQVQKGENNRRAQALKELYRMPQHPMTKQMCRSLGDAIFAFFAPVDTVVLTTNVSDHAPLANALGKQVQQP